MDEKPILQKSLFEQITDEFISILQSHAEFDKLAIEKLRHLAINKELNKPKKITKVLQDTMENKS